MSAAGFVLPPRSSVGYLDESIANEGLKASLNEEENLNWTPPPEKLVMPDWTQIKSIRKYFGRSNFPAFPTWLYHPEEEPVLCKTPDDAKRLGVVYRKTTEDEAMRYNLKHIWDWTGDSKWRPKPYGNSRARPGSESATKEYIAKHDPNHASSTLVRELIPQVAELVIKVMQQSNTPALTNVAPASINPKDWAEFQAFQAWKKSAEVVSELASDEEEEDFTESTSALGMTKEQEKTAWMEQAKDLGIKVNPQWSVDKIKQEIEKKTA